VKVTLVHNPNAGAEDQQAWDDLIEMVRRHGHSAVYVSDEDIDSETRREDLGDIVAIAGGDGTVGSVAKALIGRNVPIAILPLGTANNIAENFNLCDSTLDQLVASWQHARRVKFDAGIAAGPWDSTAFIEGLGIGLFASAMSKLDSRHNLQLAQTEDTDEKIASVIKLLKEQLSDAPARKLNITADGRDLSGDYLLAEVMNITHVGPNLHLAPDAEPGDGLLDIVLVSKDERSKLDLYLSKRLDGSNEPPELNVVHAKEVQIWWDGFDIHIDDKAWPLEDTSVPLEPSMIEIKMDRQVLEFLVPAL
jgi:diacylglycerol kinase (ATP)